MSPSVISSLGSSLGSPPTFHPSALFFFITHLVSLNIIFYSVESLRLNFSKIKETVAYSWGWGWGRALSNSYDKRQDHIAGWPFQVLAKHHLEQSRLEQNYGVGCEERTKGQVVVLLSKVKVRLQKFGLRRDFVVQFYQAVIESILTFSIIGGYGSTTQNWKSESTGRRVRREELLAVTCPVQPWPLPSAVCAGRVRSWPTTSTHPMLYFAACVLGLGTDKSRLEHSVWETLSTLSHESFCCWTSWTWVWSASVCKCLREWACVHASV